MGSANGMIWRSSVATFIALIVYVVPARAFVTTERSSSIIIFPKVVFDSSGLQSFPNPGAKAGVLGIPVDTIIQISNTSNSMAFARCFYVDATPPDPTKPPGDSNTPVCIETDFDIALTKQQPTHWLVSAGRATNPSDNKPCSVDCSNAGFDPGYFSIVPPVEDPFTGELKCIEVDSSGAPFNGNHLKGEATIVSSDGKGDASKYNAIGLLGDPNTNNGDNTLLLGGDGAEYGACPETVILNHFAENATDPVIEELGNGPSRVNTEITLVPCSEDFENQSPSPVVVTFLLINELEDHFSLSTTVTCWANLKLSSIGNSGQIFDVGTLGSRFVQTLMSAPDSGPGAGGFVGVAEEFHQTPKTALNPATSRAAENLHGQGDRLDGDTIVLPEENF